MERFLLFLVIIFIISFSNGVKSQELPKYNYEATLKGHSANLTALCMRQEDNILVSGDKNGIIHIWDIERRKKIGNLKGHTNKITHLEFDAASNRLVSASYDGTIRLWDIKKEKTIKKYQCIANKSYDGVKGNEPTFAIFSPSNRYIYYGGYNMKVIAIDVVTGKTKLIFQNDEFGITCGAISIDEKYLVFGYADKIHFWDIFQNKTAFELQKDKNDNFDNYVCELAFHPDDNNTLAVWNYNGKVDFWNLENKTINFSIKGTLQKGSSNMAFSEDGSLLLTGNSGMITNLWSLNLKQSIQTLDKHKAATQSFAFSQDGNYITTGSLDHSINIWSKEKKDIKKSKDIPDKLKGRNIEIQKTIKIIEKTIRLELWDRQTIDGDIISVNVNGKWILKNHTLSKKRKTIKLELSKTNNYVIIHAHNEGEISPNTIAITIRQGKKRKTVILNSNEKTSATLILKYLK